MEHYTDQNLNDEIQNLNESLITTIKPILKDRPLVIIGYRGAEPSIMQDLFLRNLAYTNNFHQGIYWCILRRDCERILTDDSILPPLFKELYTQTKGNFQIIPIDGFDELLVSEIKGKLNANEIDLRHVSKVLPTSREAVSPTYDTQIIAKSNIGALEIALLRERIRNYSERLRVKVYDDEEWLFQQMVRLRVADETTPGTYELTSSGTLLFSSTTQVHIPYAKVILRFVGDSSWLRKITSNVNDKDIEPEDFSAELLERTIEGNLWNQLNEITDSLSLINKPFRLKGETSENVYPYPTLALKEIIVNCLVHRDYSVDEPIIIQIDPNSMSFLSPGGLVEEVLRQLSSIPIEEEIRKGKRGIKGYRNPVLADLFYGSGAMDKEGSGLSDVIDQINLNSGSVSFGPTDDGNYFKVQIFRRPEEVNEQTRTATPLVIQQSTKFACNLFEVLNLPDIIYHADCLVSKSKDIFSKLEGKWCPPFLLQKGKIWSFYDMSEKQNPLRNFVDLGTLEELDSNAFIDLSQGTNEFVRMLNDSFIDHLFSIGLRVDTVKKRAYFTKNFDDTAKEISYQGRLKKATRTVAKPRTNLSTGKTYYWEHKSIWFSFRKIADTWYLILNPSYVFTTDGVKNLLQSERVNILSTKKASRDYNMNVHNDLTFWANYISQASENVFLLRPNNKDINEGRLLGPTPPDFVISSKLPTVTVNDVLVMEEFIEPMYLDDIDDIDEELEALAKSQQNNANGN